MRKRTHKVSLTHFPTAFQLVAKNGGDVSSVNDDLLMICSFSSPADRRRFFSELEVAPLLVRNLFGEFQWDFSRDRYFSLTRRMTFDRQHSLQSRTWKGSRQKNRSVLAFRSVSFEGYLFTYTDCHYGDGSENHTFIFPRVCQLLRAVQHTFAADPPMAQAALYTAMDSIGGVPFSEAFYNHSTCLQVAGFEVYDSDDETSDAHQSLRQPSCSGCCPNCELWARSAAVNTSGDTVADNVVRFPRERVHTP